MNKSIQVGYITASKRVAEDRKKILYMYRDAPSEDIDSGWRVFSGTEDQAYADKAENFALYNCSTILEIDPSIAPYLDAPPGSAFERADALEIFEQVPFPAGEP